MRINTRHVLRMHLVTALLQGLLDLLRVRSGGGQSGLVQILGQLLQLLDGGSTLSLQLGLELLSLGKDSTHLGLELLLHFLGVGHQLGARLLQLLDGIIQMVGQLIHGGASVLLRLLSQLARDSLQLGDVALGLILDQMDQGLVVLNSDKVQERCMQFGKGALESSE